MTATKSIEAGERTQSKYEQQAQEFLTANGLKFSIKLSNTKNAGWEPSGNHYRITLSRATGRYSKRTPSQISDGHLIIPAHGKRLAFDFWGSINDKEKGQDPTAYDVLACISGDINTPETFGDFCADYGYNADSINASKTFKQADRLGRKLRAFFTAEEQEQLAEIQ